MKTSLQLIEEHGKIPKFFKVYGGPGYPIDPKRQRRGEQLRKEAEERLIETDPTLSAFPGFSEAIERMMEGKIVMVDRRQPVTEVRMFVDKQP